MRAGAFSARTILAGLAFTGDLFFWHLTVMHTSIANGTFFATMAPLWVVVFGWLLLRQKVSRMTLFGLGLCLVGGSALVAESLAFNPAHALGDMMGIVTGVFFGLYFLAVGAARLKSGAARVTFEMSLITAALLFVVALVMEPHILRRVVWLGDSPDARLCQSCRRAGAALHRAGPSADRILVAGHFPRGDCRSDHRLDPAR